MASKSKTELIYSGALYGMIVWAIYGIVEFITTIGVPYLVIEGRQSPLWEWRFTAALFALYLLAGIVLGALSGALVSAIHRLKRGRSDSVLLLHHLIELLLVVALASNLAIQYFALNGLGRSALPPLVLSVLFGACLVASSMSTKWFQRLRPVSTPWVWSTAILGSLWVTGVLQRDSTVFVKAGTAVAYPIVVLACALAVQRVLKGSGSLSRAGAYSGASWKRLSKLSLVMVALVVVGLIAEPAARKFDREATTLIPDFQKPNVLLIVLDTVRADHLSVYGYERDTSPSLEAFAQEATLFSNAIAPGAMTLSSHGSLFTGLYSREHGAHYDPWNDYPHGRPLSPEFSTLAEMLFDNGFRTLGVVANHGYLSEAFGMSQGFDYYSIHLPLYRLSYAFCLRRVVQASIDLIAPYFRWNLEFSRAEPINDEVFGLLDKAATQRASFFLFINYMDAHVPYIPPSPYQDRYLETDYDPRVSATEIFDDRIRGRREVSKEERAQLAAQYDGEIAYLDLHIGRLLSRLRDLGLYDNTCIIVTSDHGEALGERNLVLHGVSVYQDQIHVPLIIKLPHQEAPRVVNTPVSLIDVLPTVMELLEYEIPDNVEGRSLLPSNDGDPRSVISESFPSGMMLELNEEFDRVERSIISGRFKYVHSTSGKRELYDLSSDPRELNTLHETNLLSLELQGKLDEWLASTYRQYEMVDRLDEDALDRLRALGYIQ